MASTGRIGGHPVIATPNQLPIQQIKCRGCDKTLGELLDGMVVIAPHVRGQSSRKIFARACVIVCERCGEANPIGQSAPTPDAT